MRLYDSEVETLPLEEQFLHSALHGVADEWVYLKSLADIAAALRRFPPQTVDAILVRANTLGVLPQVSSAIHLALEWMGNGTMPPCTTRPSPALLLPATDSFHVNLRARTVSRLRAQNFCSRRAAAGALAEMAAELRLAPGTRSLLEVARRYVWRPRVWAAFDLPDSLLWLYPILGALTPPRVT